MPSSFTWLDHSDRERRKVLDAIDRFKETDTRDELGISTIRDGLADLFFPGTSVLMTRARYFLFVPWIYADLEKRRITDGITNRVRRTEVQLIETLGDADGAIGRIAKGTLKRMPSNIYWLGLEAWGIRTFHGAQPDYHAALERRSASRLDILRDDDNERTEDGPRGTWHAALPASPKSFPKEATLDLTRAEAEYLRERIRLNASRNAATNIPSMLATVFRVRELSDVDFPWMHPRLADFGPELQRALAHAQCFAESIQGAALLYNLMLSEADQRDTVDGFRTTLTAWSEELQARERELNDWKLSDFWALLGGIARVKTSTKAFVDRWVELRAWESPARACDDPAARSLVRAREAQLKGQRARLANPRALELWGGASGTARLSFRWPTAKRLLRDIFSALEPSAHRAADTETVHA